MNIWGIDGVPVYICISKTLVKMFSGGQKWFQGVKP